MSYLIELDASLASLGGLVDAHHGALLGAYLEFTGSDSPTSAARRHALASRVRVVSDLQRLQLEERVGQLFQAALQRGVYDALHALQGQSPGASSDAVVAELWQQQGQRGVREQKQALGRVFDVGAAAVQQAAHAFAIEVQRLKDLGRQERSAAIEVTERAQLRPDFAVRDAMGRRWSPALYLRTGLRGALLGLRNEAFMVTASGAGALVFRADHAKAKPEVHGLQFVYRTGTGLPLPLYAEIRAKIFHPNSAALVALQ